VFVYELCCGVIQYFYGDDWDKDGKDLSVENKKD